MEQLQRLGLYDPIGGFRLGKPSEMAITLAEAEYGYSLPADYRRFLDEWNGCCVKNGWILNGKEIVAKLDEFLCMDEKGALEHSVVHNIRTWRGVYRQPFLPFAIDGGGEHFAFVREGDREVIKRLSLGLYGETYLAASFSELLSLLKPAPPEFAL